MKIKEFISQYRRDFIAIFICEHCKNEEKLTGYDDSYFHNKVIPKIECKSCGKTSPDEYRALYTKYPDGFQV